MRYTLSAPMVITSRLLPGAKVGGYTISVEPVEWKDGGFETAWFIDGPDGPVGAGAELIIRGVDQEDVPREAIRCLCSFLGAAAESYPDGENADLFPPAVVEWACQLSDEISMLACDLEGPEED